MTKRTVVQIEILLAIAVARNAVVHAQSAVVRESSPVESRADAVCGPRCVAYLLKHYGKDADVTELVREIQGTEVTKGSSLEGVRVALERRGVYTFAMQIAPSTVVHWAHPVLVHVRLAPSGSRALGHYVVLLPGESRGAAVCWNGIHGLEKINEDRLRELRSGAILLTSPEPIADPGGAVEGPIAWGHWGAASLLLAAAGRLAVGSWPWGRKSLRRVFRFSFRPSNY